MAKLYRKSAIERLSSPEQLDKALTITSPMSWLAMIGATLIIATALIWSFTGTMPTMMDATGIIVNPDSTGCIFTDSTGTVEKIYINKGQIINRGDKIIDIRNSKNEIVTMKAEERGYVSEVMTEPGMQTFQGNEIMRYTPDVETEQVVILYVPVNDAQKLEYGMKVLVTPGFVDGQKEGHMEAEIMQIEPYTASMSNMSYVLGSDNMLSEQFMQNGSVVSVRCELKEDSKTSSGYYWSNEKGNALEIQDGTLVDVKIVVDESAPISQFLTNLNDKLEG